jgi:hypothetical protein
MSDFGKQPRMIPRGAEFLSPPEANRESVLLPPPLFFVHEHTRAGSCDKCLVELKKETNKQIYDSY